MLLDGYAAMYGIILLCQQLFVCWYNTLFKYIKANGKKIYFMEEDIIFSKQVRDMKEIFPKEKKNGQGIHKYLNGNVYEGEYHNDKRVIIKKK